MPRVEDGIQASIVGYLEAVLANVWVYAIPNASASRAGHRVPGFKKGMPDLCFLWNRITFFLEVKDPKKGKLSEDQIECARELMKRGYRVATVTSVEETREVLANWGVPTREVIYEPV